MRLIDRLAQKQKICIIANNQSLFVAQACAEMNEDVWGAVLVSNLMGILLILITTIGGLIFESIMLLILFAGLHHYVSVNIIVVDRADQHVYFLDEGFGERKSLRFCTKFEEVSRVRIEHGRETISLLVDFVKGESWRFCELRSGDQIGTVQAAIQNLVSQR